MSPSTTRRLGTADEGPQVASEIATTARRTLVITRRWRRTKGSISTRPGPRQAAWGAIDIVLSDGMVHGLQHGEFPAMSDYLFTSESVTEGHPDKVCDQVSDAILDAIIAKDPTCRVACETLTKTGIVIIAGEITTDCYVDM